MAGWSAPGFWTAGRHAPWPARLPLRAVAAIVRAVAARRARRPGARVGVPVLCVGNVGVGGTGKTIVAIDLLRRLAARGVNVHALSRGYGGRERGPWRVGAGDDGRVSAGDDGRVGDGDNGRVGAGDDAARVGDEALLLAAHAPVWVGADRAASARAAVAAGAQALVMDDGLQHPGLHRDAALLVVDAVAGFGNGEVLPAGPLREPVAAAAARCDAAVVIAAADAPGGGIATPPTLPVLHASLVMDETDLARLAGRRVFAFAGIGRPEKFFDGLRQAGLDVVATRALGDHLAYHARLKAALRARAEALGAVAVTTGKDAARWGAQAPATVGVRLAWRDEAAIEALLDRWLAGRR